MYSNSYCSYKFAPKQEKIGQSSHKEYSNNILKYLEFTAIINACTKKSGNLLNAPRIYYIYTTEISHFAIQKDQSQYLFGDEQKVRNDN